MGVMVRLFAGGGRWRSGARGTRGRGVCAALYRAGAVGAGGQDRLEAALATRFEQMG